MLTTNMKKIAAAISVIIFMSGCGQVSNDTVTTTARETEAVTTATTTVSTTTAAEETDENVEETSVAEATPESEEVSEVTEVTEETKAEATETVVEANAEADESVAETTADELEDFSKTEAVTEVDPNKKWGPEEVIVTEAGDAVSMFNVENVERNVTSEIYAATYILNGYGFKCTANELLEYMPYVESPNADGTWESPNEYYLGNPKNGTYSACNVSVLKKTIENYFLDQGINDYEVVDMSGSSINELYDEFMKSNYFIVWSTHGIEDVKNGDILSIKDGTTYTCIDNFEACAVVAIIGEMGSTNVISTDREFTNSFSNLTQFEKIYNDAGSQALVIRKKFGNSQEVII